MAATEHSAAENKALVQRWLSQGVSSPASRAMVTDDFTWTGPASLGLLHEDASGIIRGAERNSTIRAHSDVEVLVMPREVYLTYWHHTYNLDEITSILRDS